MKPLENPYEHTGSDLGSNKNVIYLAINKLVCDTSVNLLIKD